MLKKIEELVQSQGHLALATSLDDVPHVSLMAYAAGPDCREFWAASLSSTRKYRNLMENPHASLLLDNRCNAEGPDMALSVEVRLQPFATPAAEASACRALLMKHGNLAEFLGLSDAVLLRFVASRMQLLSGLEDVFVVDMEKVLDADGLRA